MSVYVPGMEMPPNCPGCPFCHLVWPKSRKICLARNREEVHVNLNTGFDDACPIVEVKTPHGRLIDADAIGTEWCDPDVAYVLRDAPTVIEAEGQT